MVRLFNPAGNGMYIYVGNKKGEPMLAVFCS